MDAPIARQMLDGSAHPVAVPVRRVSASALIADALRDEIVAMRLPPGAPLHDRDLTARFGVSRTPVREALIRLAEEGLVDVRPQSGTSVARIPLAAIAEAMLIRQALEGTTVGLAAERGRTADLTAIEETLRRQEAFAVLGEEGAFHEADEAFHATIADLAGHPGIWRVVRGVKVQLDRCRRFTLPVPGRMGQVIGEHRAILRAIAEGDVPGAQSAMRHHLGVMAPDVAALAERHPAFFA